MYETANKYVAVVENATGSSEYEAGRGKKSRALWVRHMRA